MTLSGAPTPRFGIRTFADADSPDLAGGGLSLTLADIDSAIRYRGPLTVAAFGGANYGLPTAPVDGDLVSLIIDATAGVEWLLRYVAAEITYKWRAIGAAALYSEVVTAEATTSAGYAGLLTGGPSIPLPRAGDYKIEHGCGVALPTLRTTGFMSYDIGASGAIDADAVSHSTATPPDATPGFSSASRQRVKTGLTAVTLTAKYRSPDGGSIQFNNRYLAATPVRIA